MSVNFKVSGHDETLIKKIMARVIAEKPQMDALHIEMDLTATHANGCPLDLGKLLAFPDFDFWHDIYGIGACIDRATGKLGRCFLPRCARPQREGARH